MKETEHLQEDWVKFRRHYCLDGFIDFWQGDCAHDPNYDEKPHICLNSFTSYARLNGEGEWINQDDFMHKNLGATISKYANLFTAEDLFYLLEYKKP